MGHCLPQEWKCASRLLKIQLPPRRRHADVNSEYSTMQPDVSFDSPLMLFGRHNLHFTSGKKNLPAFSLTYPPLLLSDSLTFDLKLLTPHTPGAAWNSTAHCSPARSTPTRERILYLLNKGGNKQTRRAGVQQRAGTVSSLTAPERLLGERAVSLRRGSDTEQESAGKIAREEEEEEQEARERKSQREGQVPATPVKHLV